MKDLNNIKKELENLKITNIKEFKNNKGDISIFTGLKDGKFFEYKTENKDSITKSYLELLESVSDKKEKESKDTENKKVFTKNDKEKEEKDVKQVKKEEKEVKEEIEEKEVKEEEKKEVVANKKVAKSLSKKTTKK